MIQYPHRDPEFRELLEIVGERNRIDVTLIEKDYWVTHTLWALKNQGFDLWFKGGTSLSKGFSILERFSEDLDLKIEPGSVHDVMPSPDWSSRKKGNLDRRSYFERLVRRIKVPDAEVQIQAIEEQHSRSASFMVKYNGSFLPKSDSPLRPFVLLELGSAQVTPFVERDLSSFVHDYLVSRNQLSTFAIDNRPARIRCVHPFVTLLEKIDAISRRFERSIAGEGRGAETFVRHYEDAACIIAADSKLPPMDGQANVRALAEFLSDSKQIKRVPSSNDRAFHPDETARWIEIQQAYDSIASMYWGTRRPLEIVCATIRDWIRTSLEITGPK